MTKPDYQTLIDAPTWAFIERTLGFTPPGNVAGSIEAQRESYDGMCAAFHAGRPPGVGVTDESAGGVPVRRYETDRPAGTVVYLHGGGFVLGGLDSHDDICAEIAATGPRVVSIDYRLAPEHPHPAAYFDMMAAIRATAARSGPVVLAGDSAGAALAASASHALRGAETVRGIVLIYPGLGGSVNRGSMLTHANAPLLSRSDILAYQDARFGSGPVVRDATSAVLADTDFSGLPKISIFVAECDPLADDGYDYADAIRAAGGEARCVTNAGMVHGWLRARHSVPRARAAFDGIVRAIGGMV